MFSNYMMSSLITQASRAPDTRAVLICLVLVTVAVIALFKKKSDHFYTESNQEAPTRLEVPYTGTEPLGVWGSMPWGDSAYAM